MSSRAKVQRRKKTQGGRWTDESLKRLYDLRNIHSHLTWPEFYRKNLFPDRTLSALQKAFSSYTQKIAAKRKTKRMQAAASTRRHGLYAPSTPVVKRPAQVEKDPRLRNRKQARLDVPSEHHSFTPPGPNTNPQGPNPNPPGDTDSEAGDISHSGRTEKLAQQAKVHKSHHARPSTISTAPKPRIAPKIAEKSESLPEQEPHSGSQPCPKLTTSPIANKGPGASAADLPTSAQSEGYTSQAQQPSQVETILAELQVAEVKKFCEKVEYVVNRDTKWKTERQDLEAIIRTQQTINNSLQTKNDTLQKNYDASQKSLKSLTSKKENEIEQLKTEKQELSNEISRLRDESRRDYLRLREIMIIKEKELAEKRDGRSLLPSA